MIAILKIAEPNMVYYLYGQKWGSKSHSENNALLHSSQHGHYMRGYATTWGNHKQQFHLCKMTISLRN